MQYRPEPSLKTNEVNPIEIDPAPNMQIVAFVHASTVFGERLALWQELGTLKPPASQPWIFHAAEIQALPAIGSDHSPLILRMHPSLEEIHGAVFQLGAFKAPGPDGFNGSFYQQSWESIKDDLAQLVQEFFQKGVLDNRLNQTHIVLIPKVKSPLNQSRAHSFQEGKFRTTSSLSRKFCITCAQQKTGKNIRLF